MKALFGLLLAYCLFNSCLGQNLTIPGDDCTWRGENYGRENFCQPNEIPIGSCGSGRDPDCGASIYHQLLCCPLDNFHYEGCTQFNGDYGEHLICKEKTGSDHQFVAGICGSGRDKDCEADSCHEIHCCKGVFTNNNIISNTGNCYWKYGDYGEQVMCNFDFEAIFGRCGSGSHADCSGEYHGIYCCGLLEITDS